MTQSLGGHLISNEATESMDRDEDDALITMFIKHLEEWEESTSKKSSESFCSLCKVRIIESKELHEANMLHRTNLKLVAGGYARIAPDFYCKRCDRTLRKSKLEAHFDSAKHQANVPRCNFCL